MGTRPVPGSRISSNTWTGLLQLGFQTQGPQSPLGSVNPSEAGEGSRDRGALWSRGMGAGGLTVKGSKVSGHTVGNQPNQEHPGIDPSLTACQRGLSIPSTQAALTWHLWLPMRLRLPLKVW